MKPRRTYTAEFKLNALRLLENSSKSAAQIERDLGIGDGCLRHWKKKLLEDGEHAFPGHGFLTPEQEEIRGLKRRLEVAEQEREIAHKGHRHLLARKAVKFEFIEECRDDFPVTRMCKVLEVSPSGYYAWRHRRPSAREIANEELVQRIEAVYSEPDGT